MTFNEHGNAMLARIAELRISANSAPDGSAAIADLDLARTHLEDALTRFNSACYRIAGTWGRADAERHTGLITPPAGYGG